MDFDFATLLSSPSCSCILFAIVLGQLVKLEFLAQHVELKWLTLDKMRKIIPFVTCEITFGQNVCELMFGINVSKLNFRIEINSVKQPIQSDSVGS